MATGTVKWFNGDKGFGFISQDVVDPTSSCITAPSTGRATATSNRDRKSSSRLPRPRRPASGERHAALISPWGGARPLPTCDKNGVNGYWEALAAPTTPIGREPRLSRPRSTYPELRYRIKTRLLGPPLHTEQLAHERLGIPTALAVFSSDCISSSAYATEQILNKLIPWVGLLAFSLVVPITVALLVVLFFLILSYRETIKEYPTAGGAYMVTRDNFGLLPAQAAGVALLTDYVLTVSVSTAAGTDALTSAVRSLAPYDVGIALAFVAILMFGNLKGVRESGKLFVAPTYFFIVMMLGLITLGIVKWMGGSLHPQDVTHLHGTVKIGTHGVSDALLYGAGIFLVLKAFASGGPRSTAWKPSPTGSPPSGVQFSTPARPWSSWAPRWACCSSACRSSPPDAPDPVHVGFTDGHLPVRAWGVRRRGRRPRTLLPAPGRHHAHPGPRGQHQLRRLPATGELPRGRRLHAQQLTKRRHRWCSATASSPWRWRPPCCSSSPAPRSTG